MQFFLVNQGFGNSQQQDFDIKKEIPVLNIVNVVADALLNRGVAPQAVDLGPTGDTGTDLMLHHIQRDLFFKLLNIMWDLRPGSHQAHIPLEDIEQLGQLVNGTLLEQGAEFGLTGVGVPAPSGVLLCVDPHGAEFIHLEGLVVAAHPLLLEDHRPRR